MMSLNDHLTKATHLVASGDLDGAVLHYDQVLSGLLAQGDADVAMLADIGGDLTELLRWHHRYDEAIDLQLTLADAIPAQARDFTLMAATLRIENGDVTGGLAAMSKALQGHDQVVACLLLGTTYAWLDRSDEALLHLRRAFTAPQASLTDRATASHLMFQLLGARKNISAAVAAWTAARDLDGQHQTYLPELLRMLIHWYQYHTAEAYLPQLHSEIARTCFRTILASKVAALPSRRDWSWVHDYDPATLSDDADLYAEAALRAIAPDLALAAVMPLIEAGDLARRPLVLAGLAFAQQRDVGRAQWAMDQALRLADLERPRRTRPGLGTARIFDAEIRMVYGEVPIDSDVRALLDHYFMPGAADN